MKKRSFYSILFYSILFFAVIPFFSCSDSGSDDSSDNKSEEKFDVALSDVNFDLSKLTLTAKVPLANGTVVTAACNGFSKEAQVDEGVISWDLAQAFTASVRAGKEYKVSFSAPKCKFKDESVWYFTDISYKINCNDEIVVFTDTIDSFVLPVIKVNNYDEADVEINATLKAKGSTLDLEQFKALVKQELQNPPEDETEFNNALSASCYCTITPKNVTDSAIKSKLSIRKEIVITFKYQVQVKSVKAEIYDNSLEALCFAEETPLEEGGETAGGKLSYQWQSSTTGTVNSANIEEGWSDISGATSKSYNITQDTFGKYLRVKVVQAWNDVSSGAQTLAPVYSAPTAKISNFVNTSFTSLAYDGVVLKGESPDSSKLSGTIIDILGKEFKPSDFTIEVKNKDGLNSSGECIFILSKAGYENSEVGVFVTVQNVISESNLPKLSTQTDEISAGFIKFDGIDSGLEYSLYNSGNWKAIDSGEISAQEGLVFYFRYPVKGTPNTAGYIKESEVLSLTVSKDNIGKKPKAIVLTDVNFDLTKLTLSAKTSLEKGTVIKATCSSNNHFEEAHVENGTISWNLTQAFPANVLAGKQYKVTLTADGYSSKEENIWYYTTINYKINCDDEIVIFTDSIETFELPEIKVTNYDAEDVTIDSSFRAQGANLGLEEFKELVEEELGERPDQESDFSEGLSAIYRYSISPKNVNDRDLKSKLTIEKEISITFKYQKRVNSVGVAWYDDTLEALCFEEKSVPDSEIETAGGKLSYQWQSSTNSEDGWSDISGATAKTFQLTSSSFGKYYRVKVVQTWTDVSSGSKVLDPIYSAPTAKISNYVNTSFTTLVYDGVVLKGETPDSSKISGTIFDISGNELQPSDFTIELKNKAGLNSSGECAFKLSKEGYEKSEVNVFVTVQNKIAENNLPKLSTQTDEISARFIKFDKVDSALEYSLYNNGNWKPFESGEIPAQEGLVLYFRYPANGTPNTAGYIKESEALSLTVSKANIGTKLKNIILTDVNFDLSNLTLSAKTSLENGIVIKATCSSNNYSVEAQVENGVIAWNLAQAFPVNVLAGKQYKVTLTADGYNSKEENVWYFANVKYNINCERQLLLFTNAIDIFELPEIKVFNYDAEDITIEASLRAQGANLTLEDFKALVKEELANSPDSESDFNDGLSAVYRYTITPKHVEDSELLASLTVSEEIDITFKYQVMVGSVGINRYDEYLTALCFEEETAPDSDIENAGGKITYQWQWSLDGSDNWRNIEGATTKDLLLTSNYNFVAAPDANSCYGKFFRVKVVQEWMVADGTYSAMPPLFSESTAKIVKYVNTSKSTLTYDGIVMKGEKVDLSKLKGEIVDINGTTLALSDFIITPKYDEVLNCSSKCVFVLSKTGYEDAEMTVFVTVQNVIKEDNIPNFDNAIDKISAGNIKFAQLNYDMEYSRFYQGNWKQISDEEVPAYDGLKLYFRYAAVGTPNTVGYIKESEALCRTVTQEYIGTKTSGSGIIDGIENTKLVLSKKTDSQGNITISPIIKNEPLFEGAYTFDYMIDDMKYSASIYSDKNIRMSENALVIPAGVLASDTYQILCTATVSVNGQLVKVLSTVYSLKIK
ncbi:hypothetical protein [Treponema ruminis]|uniref:Uncharacterized protein n=1 Tax=Treponema ruminis TaxID=744515 RepID=A0A7W8G6S4_9SPIR|nr:hypothetical protein [Treponema ruminis]MBB5224878.1 hypothetical protein [Treponema ruminis]